MCQDDWRASGFTPGPKQEKTEDVQNNMQQKQQITLSWSQYTHTHGGKPSQDIHEEPSKHHECTNLYYCT